MYLKNLGMISALLIAGLLYGCGDSKDTRMVDFRVKDYPADVAIDVSTEASDLRGLRTECRHSYRGQGG
jgi:hypothetical protein